MTWTNTAPIPLAADLDWSPGIPATPTVVVGARFEVTASGHDVRQSDSWISPAVVVGDYLYVIYLATYNPFPTLSGRVYLRRITRSTGAVATIGTDLYPTHIQPIASGVHPAMTRDQTGALMVCWPYFDSVAESHAGILCQGSTTVGLARLLPTPDDSATWSVESPSGGHMRTRVTNNAGSSYCGLSWGAGKFLCGYLFRDPSTLYDPNTGTAYFKGRTNNLEDWTLDGVATINNALTEMFHRLSSPFSTTTNSDGPYILVECPTSQAYDPPVSGAGAGKPEANVKMFLGREAVGNKTLYMTWYNKEVFVNTGNPSGLSWWNRDLYCARSVDRGVTWTNWAGSYSKAITARIQRTESQFLLKTGTYWAEYSEGGADVDVDGNLHLLLHRTTLVESDWYTAGTTNFDWARNSPVNFDGPKALFYGRFAPDGSYYEHPVALLTETGMPHRIQIISGRRGELLIIREQPIRYNYSADNGVTWSGWVDVDTVGNLRLFTQIVRDPFDPLRFDLLYHDFTALNQNKLYWRSVRFGPASTAAPTGWTARTVPGIPAWTPG